jgi:CubicO group peptidase (beta-lactamase class C family)
VLATLSSVSAFASPPPSDLQPLLTEIEAIRRESDLPGVGLALVSSDSVLFCGGLGVADRETGTAVTDSTLFPVASVTKCFTALACLRLVEDGALDLEARLVDLVPGVKIENPWRDTHPVRLVHLLEHTAGIDDQHFNESYNLHDPPDLPLEDVLAINPGSRRVVWPPGSRTAYSNDGYAVVGRVLEILSGERYEDHVERAVLKPLGLVDATFFPGGDADPRLARGYREDGTRFPYTPLYMRPASSLTASPRDLARLVRFLLRRGRTDQGRLLSPATIRRMETPASSFAARKGLTVGYGLGNRSRFWHGHRYQGHGGGIPGHAAMVAYSPELDRGFVVLSNRSPGGGFHRILECITRHLAAETPPPRPPSVGLPAERRAELAGTYEYRSSASRLDAMLNVLLAGVEVFAKGDSLFRRGLGEEPTPLIPVAPDRFRRPDEPEATILITRDEAGDSVLVDEDSYYVRVAAWRPGVYRGLLVAALLMAVSAVPWALFWIPAALRRRRRAGRGSEGGPRPRTLIQRSSALLSVVCLFAFVVAMGRWSANVRLAGERTAPALVLAGATWLGAALAVLAFVLALWGVRGQERRPARIYALALSTSLVGLFLFLAHWDVLGLRVWAY